MVSGGGPVVFYRAQRDWEHKVEKAPVEMTRAFEEQFVGWGGNGSQIVLN